MAGASLLTLIDDIATLLDDIAVMSKVAAKKTAGVLGDDLALNAQQVSGVKADRELPVVWAVAKGSFVNKLILVPLALLISAFAPFLITPLLMLGGLFLCYEGCEKVLAPWLHGKHAEQKEQQIDIHNKHYEQQNQRRNSHRFYSLCRNYCYFIRHSCKRKLYLTAICIERYRNTHDHRCVWFSSVNCEN